MVKSAAPGPAGADAKFDRIANAARSRQHDEGPPLPHVPALETHAMPELNPSGGVSLNAGREALRSENPRNYRDPWPRSQAALREVTHAYMLNRACRVAARRTALTVYGGDETFRV